MLSRKNASPYCINAVNVRDECKHLLVEFKFFILDELGEWVNF